MPEEIICRILRLDGYEVFETEFDESEMRVTLRIRQNPSALPAERELRRHRRRSHHRPSPSKAVKKRKGPLALLHFDAHLDTWDTYFGAAYTHGTPFRRAFEEGLLLEERSMHVGIRGPLFSPQDLVDDESFGSRVITAMDFETQGLAEIVQRVRARIGDRPLYVCIDIDVLDPGSAPGTGTPEAGGLTSRELLGVLRGLRGLGIAAADLVEVAPPYDHAEVTAMAASHVVYELISLFAAQRADRSKSG
jgi:agmatinase